MTVQPDTTLTGSPMACVNGFNQTVFTIPTGVHLISIVTPQNTAISLLQVFGNATGATYLTAFPVNDQYQMQYYVLIPEGADTKINVDVTALAPCTVYVTGVTAPVAVGMIRQNPAPWEAPNRPPLTLSFANPGIGNTVSILTGPGNFESIWLHSMTYIWDVASPSMGGQWEDTNGTQLAATVAVAAGIPHFFDFKGAHLKPNAGFQFMQNGSSVAGTTNCRGTLVYSVY